MQPSLRLCLLILLCFSGSLARAAELVIAVARTPLSLPLFVAENSGYFKSLPVTISLKPCVSGARCMEMMLDGDADMATASDMVVMNAYLREAPFAVLTTFAYASGLVSIIARKNAGILKTADLKGKRVGYTEGTSSHFYLESTLVYAGLKRSDLLTHSAQPNMLQQQLLSGELDAISVWTPWNGETRTALGEDAVELEMPEGYVQTFNLVKPRRLSESQTATLPLFLAAIEKASADIQNNAALAESTMLKSLDLKPDSSQVNWENFDFGLRLDSRLVHILENQARWKLVSSNRSLEEMPNLFDFIDVKPLNQVFPDRVTLGH